MTSQQVKKMPVRIYEEWCKGCNICVSFCPTQTLELSRSGKSTVAHPAKCIYCGLCELLCPDLAITVRPKPAKKTPVSDSKDPKEAKDAKE